MSGRALQRVSKVLRSERGTAALEFAIVAQLLILLLYGIITYGFVFALDHNITQAAAEGARHAISEPTNASDTTIINDAISDARDHISFAAAQTNAVVTADIIQNCNGTSGLRCIHVSISYDWRSHPLIPGFVGMQYLTPSQISADSTVELTS
jgi:Flp pilus assembly protein TadG